MESAKSIAAPPRTPVIQRLELSSDRRWENLMMRHQLSANAMRRSPNAWSPASLAVLLEHIRKGPVEFVKTLLDFYSHHANKRKKTFAKENETK